MAARVAEAAKSSTLRHPSRHTVSASAAPSRPQTQYCDTTSALHGSGVTAAYGYAAGYSAHETYGWHHSMAYPNDMYGAAYGGAYADPSSYYEQAAVASTLDVDMASAAMPALASSSSHPSVADPSQDAPPPPPPGEDDPICPPPPLPSNHLLIEADKLAECPPLPPPSSPPLPPPEVDIDMAVDEPEASSERSGYRTVEPEPSVRTLELTPAEAAAAAAAAAASLPGKKRKIGEGTGVFHVNVSADFTAFLCMIILQ